MVIVHLLDPHPRLREARAVPVAPVALLHVFAEGKLDERHGLFVQEVLGLSPPSKLDDGALAANGVGGTVEDLGARHAARKLAVHVHVLAVDGVANPHFGAAGLGSLVHAAVDGNVGVFVDDTGRDVLASAVNFSRNHPGGQQGRGLELGAHGDDLAFVNQHVRALQHAFRFARPHGRVSNPHGFLGQAFGGPVGRERVGDAGHVQRGEVAKGVQFRRLGRIFRRRRIVLGGAVGRRVGRCAGRSGLHQLVRRIVRVFSANRRPIGPFPVGQLARTFPDSALHPHVACQTHRAVVGRQPQGHHAVFKLKGHFGGGGVVEGPSCLPRVRRPRDFQHEHAVVHVEVVRPCEVQRVAVAKRRGLARHPVFHDVRAVVKQRAVGDKHVGVRPLAKVAQGFFKAEPRRWGGRQRGQRHGFVQAVSHGLPDAA